jgi:hypothetical protein
MFTAVESSFRHIFNKQKAIHIHKFSWLYDQQNKASSAPTPDSKKFVLNLSKHILTDSEEAVLAKGLNFLLHIHTPTWTWHVPWNLLFRSFHRLKAWNSGGKSGPC